MPSGLKTQFQQGHDVKYGLEVAERHPESAVVISVACRFCVKFGREENKNGKRKRTTKTQYFKRPFRADNFTRHLNLVHPSHWKRYSAASDEEKKTFFNQPNLSNTMLAHVDRDQPLYFEIKRSIVDEIIGDLLFDADDVEVHGSMATALSIFKPASDEIYKVKIGSPRLFNLLVGYVSNGASFRSAAAHARTTQVVTKLSYLNGASDARCSLYIRAVCAASLDHIHHILQSCWAYSLALDVGSVQGTSYLDIRVRFHSGCGKLVNVHLLAVPLFLNKTASTLFGACTKLMNVLDENWRSKL